MTEYFVKYVKRRRYALVEKTRRFTDLQKALDFAAKHEIANVIMRKEDQERDYYYDYESDTFVCM